MQPYQPFLIAPYATGLDTTMEPWLQPIDAFPEIENAQLHHGFVQKRLGYSELAPLVHSDGANWSLGGAPAVTQANPGVVTVTSAVGLSNGDIVEFRSVGGMTQLNGNRYEVDSVGATTFELTDTVTTNFTAHSGGGAVYLVPELPVMGIGLYIDSSGGKVTLAFDTQRACVFNNSSGVFDPLDTSDIFSGSSSDYVFMCNWASSSSSSAAVLDRMYFTNGLAYSAGLNGIRYYDGSTTTTSFRPTINGVTSINGCMLIFAMRDRLFLLHTIEGARTYPQRVRWCQIQNPDHANAWDDNAAGRGGFVDAPTSDQIVSAVALKDYLVVYFTNSVWILSPNPDPALPVRWNKLNDFRSCDGKMASIGYDSFAIAAGVRGITASDTTQTVRIDERIQDFISDEVNRNYTSNIFFKRNFELQRTWMLYPRLESEDTNAALVYDDDSKAFSTATIDMNVLGYGSQIVDATIADFNDQTLDEFGDDETLQSYFYGDDSELFLGGDSTGMVHVMEQGDEDGQRFYSSSIVAVTQANPGVVTVTSGYGLSNGDVISIDNVAGMTQLNDRYFTVSNATGNTFELTGVNTSGYGVYTSGGSVNALLGDHIDMTLLSAGWNPWIKEGRRAQFGYMDFYVTTNQTTELQIEFFKDDEETPYRIVKTNCLSNQREHAIVTSITNANPGVVSAPEHGFVTGQTVYIELVDGMTNINGMPFEITVISPGSFSIDRDTTDDKPYIGGGVVCELPFKPGKTWKRVYAGGTGYLHRIKITSSGKNAPLTISAFMPWFKPVGNRVIG
jgi:hypothetical protein